MHADQGQTQGGASHNPGTERVISSVPTGLQKSLTTAPSDTLCAYTTRRSLHASKIKDTLRRTLSAFSGLVCMKFLGTRVTGVNETSLVRLRCNTAQIKAHSLKMNFVPILRWYARLHHITVPRTGLSGNSNKNV